MRMQKKQEQELRERAERFQSIFDNSTLGIFQSSLEGRFLMVNDAFAKILGYENPDDLLKSMRDIERQLYHDPKSRVDILSVIREKRGFSKFQTDLCRKDGSLITCSFSIRAIRSRTGEISHLDGFIDDVTEAFLKEKQLREFSETLIRENRQLRSQFQDRYRLGQIIGKSALMQDVYEGILQAAESDAAIIIYGESGTGKELAARAIHELGKRKNKEFVPVNCGAIPEHLLESEFFGHKKGAFTGASLDSRGYLDKADGGTLFLDEIGELRLDMQVKLLRAIDGGMYHPVGDSRARKSDFRLISATNRNLRNMVKNGEMREDFFFRIDIVQIDLPPLRQRREDIPLLIDHFVRELAGLENPDVLPGYVLGHLYKYDYPGNVRELQNILRRYLATGKLVFFGHHQPFSSKREGGFTERLKTYEREIIESCLIQNRWHREHTAASLGISRKTLYTKMKEHGLDLPKSGPSRSD